MKKSLLFGFALLGVQSIGTAHGAPGEWWEITSKMEMEGMPFAMPSTTARVCIGKGAASDPRQSMPDKECKVSDIKTSGNKTSWKVRCVRDGEVMNGTGDITSTPDSYNGKLMLSGSAGGQAMNMITRYQGKRIGPACDSAPAK
ncbi:MAG: DUF3617 family protein [Gallionella sp.]|nr:DUF3617 family protein [Gallionella sp.]